MLQTSDIEDAREAGEVGIMLSLGDGARLKAALRLSGCITARCQDADLTWNDRNLIGDGAAFSVSRGGLTPFGFKVVEETPGWEWL